MPDQCVGLFFIFDMQKKFLTNLFLLLSLNLLIKPFWILGIDRAVQNLVGAEDYGFYFAVLNFSFLFNILLDFGITNFNNRNIAQNDHLLSEHFPRIVALKLVLGIVYIIVSISCALIIGYNKEQLIMLAWLGASQFLLYFVLYLRSNISGLHLFKTDSVISVLDRVLMIVFCGILLVVPSLKVQFNIHWFVYSQVAAYLVTATIAFIIVLRKASFIRLKWDIPFFGQIIRQSFPFAVLVLLMGFYNRIDSVMMERMLEGSQGKIQAGIYASAFRLLDATNMIAYLFSVILLPMFARMIKRGENIEKLAKLAFTLLFTISVLVAAGSYFYSYQLMKLLYKEHVDASAEVFRLLMIGFIAISTTYVFGTLLTANGNLKQLNIMAASGMLLNIGLNLILIPRFLATGSAYASLITQFATASIQVIIAYRIFKLKPNYRLIAKLLLYAIGVTTIAWVSSSLPGKWGPHFIALIVLSLIWMAILNIKNIFALLSMVRQNENS